MFPFEKLEVWHKALEFGDSVYLLTKAFPEDERFGLTSQMRRAAVSVASNIAEGSARYSRNDFAHFIEIATGSLFEVVTQAAIGRRQGYLSESKYSELYAFAEEHGKMLSGLRRSLIAP
jgi:four helix bundle protein